MPAIRTSIARFNRQRKPRRVERRTALLEISTIDTKHFMLYTRAQAGARALQYVIFFSFWVFGFGYMYLKISNTSLAFVLVYFVWILLRVICGMLSGNCF